MLDMTDAAPPRVLMAVEQLRRAVPGGIGAYARGLLSGLAQCAEGGEATDVTLLASRAPRSGPREDPLARFSRPLVISRLPGPVLTRAWDHGWYRVPPGFDIVHSISLAAPPSHGVPPGRAVVTVHDVAWRRHPEATTTRGRKWHEAALCRARDSGAALVVTSRLVAADLVDDGVDADRITIVQGGSDHLVPEDRGATTALLDRLGVASHFLLTVSTLEPRKNVDRLLAAYQRVRPTLPEPWPLLIVGPTGWGQALSDPEHQEGVVFSGTVADAVLAGLYRRARAFAYVPLTEGYGLPPLEAMHSGTPTVVSNEVPSVHDLDQPGQPPALIVDPFDVDQIADALSAVLTDDTVRADLGARGQSYARTRTWRAAAFQHINLWNSLA
ncbi:MAG TPA: glycosyltransferase family 1 protein [Acidimicrobiales bacterium]|jgi:glycosyltransferase involved in cell wall biosynthesis